MELSAPRRWTEKRKQAWGDLTRLSNGILRIEKGVTVTQDSQAGTRGRRKAARTENAERAGSASGPAVQCDNVVKLDVPQHRRLTVELGAAKKDDRGERACRQSLFHSWTDAVTSGLTVNVRTERKPVISRRALARPAEGTERLPSEQGEHQVEQQEPHGEATRDSHQSGCGQESQLRASRMNACLAS